MIGVTVQSAERFDMAGGIVSAENTLSRTSDHEHLAAVGGNLRIKMTRSVQERPP